MGTLRLAGVEFRAQSRGAVCSPSTRFSRGLHVPRLRTARQARRGVTVQAISSPEKVQAKPLLAPDESNDEYDAYCGQACESFIDRDGDIVDVMCCDYGFRSGTGRLYQSDFNRIPKSAWGLAISNFQFEYRALRRSFRYNEYKYISEKNPAKSLPGRAAYALGQGLVLLFSNIDKALEKANVLPSLRPLQPPREIVNEETGDLTPSCRKIRSQLAELTLDNDKVWDREHKREAGGGAVPTPWYVKSVYLALCVFLDVMYENRPVQRFWFLEMVARMPYFSYITMLHLYESLGWWRAGAELRKVHFAEEWNELHHLQIMETLGGDQLWFDRFLAQHAAIFYYLVLCVLFVFTPRLAYNFSELIEAHAVDTYGEFAEVNKELLQKIPPPLVAVKYYRGEDLYMFDEFQTSQKREARRPTCSNLYDVFCNICDDEGEHVKTMKACQDSSIVDQLEYRDSE